VPAGDPLVGHVSQSEAIRDSQSIPA
jgi:hypothetical protein